MQTPSLVPAAPPSFNRVFFTTLRLRDALPESFVQNLALQYYAAQQSYAEDPEREKLLLKARKRLFARYDEALDLEQYGQGLFRIPSLRCILAEEMARRDGPDCRVLASSILPNHVHLLLYFPGGASGRVPVNELECLHYQPLRHMLSNIQHATDTALKTAMGKLGEPPFAHSFEKRGPNGNIVLEENLWHTQSFDFQVFDALALERTAQFILKCR